ncbi:MAG: 4Fe-4S binding protein, partial [Chitinophagaceae bacterium]
MKTIQPDSSSNLNHDESFRDKLATVNDSGKRNWIYAQKPGGKFYKYRTYLSYIFFGIFVAIPFVRINGIPLFLFDVTRARFVLFGKIFWPQDFFIFGLAMVTFIVFIILFTAAFGRLFCGWVCPQTIFMEMLFRKLEFLIEGTAARQKQRNEGKWTTEKMSKKLFKHLA